ncbi:MAG: sulfotransferase [Chloroflexota bacterium]
MPQAPAPRPDFFHVGVFKGGSTALYEALRRHPQIFMPFHKEPLYFGDDLTRRYGRMSLDDYLRLFRDAKPGQRVGEASTWYLYSTSAAREIREFAPDARITVMLRNPVDVMYAQHNQLIFNAMEPISDFSEALEAEADRRVGGNLPPWPINVENLFYRHSVRFAEQLERYFEVFGRERVHVMLFDDLSRDGAAVVRGALEFLGVDPSLAAAPPTANESRRVRSPRLQRLIFMPRLLMPLAPLLRRFPLVRALRTRLLNINSEARPRAPMDPGLRRRLLDEQAPEIERLGRLIDRDLSPWLEDAGPYRINARPMGLRPGINLDKALHLAAEIEDEESIRRLQHRK